MSRLALACLLASLLACACASSPEPERRILEFRGPTMGTTYSVKVVTGPAGLPDAAHLDRQIRADLERITELMSTWDPESELSRFNRFMGPDPFPLSPETFEVFQWSKDIGARTGGALDVTVGPLVDAWGFGPSGRRARFPTEAEIERLRQAVGVHLLELDEAALTVRKKRPDVRCDLSALAPGYAVDRLSTRLVDRGLRDFLVDVSGELRAQGRNEKDERWQVAIERPDEAGQIGERIVRLSDLAIATSGDYRNFFEIDGVRATHILDPRTGRPISNHLASVTVMDRLAVRADAFATALMVLGPDQGLALAERLNLAALFLVREDNEGFLERTTTTFDTLTKPTTQP
jgi:thiamine biosynthesis lipoprotein